ncbi:MAG: hypothetical protein KKE76_01370 [Gammaproteobacteria bacterium]|nr:hypothetical protein [Gammaproteobacteria bacterium]
MRIILIVLVVLASSYAGLWLGFVKGYEYAQKQSALDAMFTVNNLKNLREGETEKVIDSLELELDTAIVEYAMSGEDLSKYLVGLPSADPNVYVRAINFIEEYRDSTPRKCDASEDVCAVISRVLKGVE